MKITESRLRKIIRSVIKEARIDYKGYPNIHGAHRGFNVTLKGDSWLKKNSGFGINVESKIEEFLTNNVDGISNVNVSPVRIDDSRQEEIKNNKYNREKIESKPIGKATLSLDLYGKRYNNIELLFLNSYITKIYPESIIAVEIKGQKILNFFIDGKLDWYTPTHSYSIAQAAGRAYIPRDMRVDIDEHKFKEILESF